MRLDTHGLTIAEVLEIERQYGRPIGETPFAEAALGGVTARALIVDEPITLLTTPAFTVDPVVMGGYDVLQSVRTPTGAAIRPVKAPPGWNRKARRKVSAIKRQSYRESGNWVGER